MKCFRETCRLKMYNHLQSVALDNNICRMHKCKCSVLYRGRNGRRMLMVVLLIPGICHLQLKCSTIAKYIHSVEDRVSVLMTLTKLKKTLMRTVCMQWDIPAKEVLGFMGIEELLLALRTKRLYSDLWFYFVNHIGGLININQSYYIKFTFTW